MQSVNELATLTATRALAISERVYHQSSDLIVRLADIFSPITTHMISTIDEAYEHYQPMKINQSIDTIGRYVNLAVDNFKIKIHLLFLRHRQHSFEDLIHRILHQFDPVARLQHVHDFIDITGPTLVLGLTLLSAITVIMILGYRYWTAHIAMSPYCDKDEVVHSQPHHVHVTAEFHDEAIKTVSIHQRQFIPPHLVLLRYIHPNTSMWPVQYLRAFHKAQDTQLLTNTGERTHIDTPPAANTRRQRDRTAKRWNGMVVLSRKGVMRDLKDGVVGLRKGVRADNGHGGMAEWEGVEWID